jgi:CMP-N,N'-diacetyllegionaminic acid synthase
MNVLGIIVARGGSRGIPRKNMAMLNGKPLLWYTIQAAKQSRLDRLIVSTDCDEIAAYCKAQGVDVPFMRPAELATDEARSVDVAAHAMQEVHGYSEAFLLQPTNPLRTVEDIDGAIALMESTGCDSVIGFSEVGERHPYRMFRRYGEIMSPVIHGTNIWKRRQDLPKVYLRCGNVYLTRTDCILRGDLEGLDSRPWIVPAERAINIDEPLDLKVCEALMLGEA